MTIKPVLSETTTHTVGLTENIPFAATYPVLDGTTTVLAFPAHFGVHMTVSLSQVL